MALVALVALVHILPNYSKTSPTHAFAKLAGLKSSQRKTWQPKASKEKTLKLLRKGELSDGIMLFE